MKSTSEKISVLEKIGYSLGDLSANLIFQTLMTFLAYFYTDVYRVPPAAASAIIFAGGMVGAFFNPVMGAIPTAPKPAGENSVPGFYGLQFHSGFLPFWHSVHPTSVRREK